MCGIVGYVGPRDASEFLIEGLRRLEYRGYDSAGIGTITSERQIAITKSVGRIEMLDQEIAKFPVPGKIGIGHTRWATHGPATQINAHPHTDTQTAVAIVHNGVIENYCLIKDRLQAKGHQFQSATDSEVIAHLIAETLAEVRSELDNPEDDVAEMLRLVTGWDTTEAELLRIAERSMTIHQLFNIRRGFTARDDVIPDRFFEPVKSGPLADKPPFLKDDFERAKRSYYRLMGWDENGIPETDKLAELEVPVPSGGYSAARGAD